MKFCVSIRHLHQRAFWEGYFSPSFRNWTCSLNQSSVYGEKNLQRKIHLLLKHPPHTDRHSSRISLQGPWRESTWPAQAGQVSLRLCQLCFMTFMPFPLCLLARKATHTQLPARLTFLTFHQFWPPPVTAVTQKLPEPPLLCVLLHFAQNCAMSTYILQRSKPIKN